jgi:hypothetical protein
LPMTLRMSAPVWLAIALLLILFALWCGLADERWIPEEGPTTGCTPS